MTHKKRLDTLPKWCKKGIHYLQTAPDIAADGRCIHCRRKRERTTERPERFAFPQTCRKGEHELRSEKDCIGDTMRCRKCEIIRKRRYAQEKAHEAQGLGQAKPQEPVHHMSLEEDHSRDLYLFTLNKVREALQASVYEMASWAQVPLQHYQAIEECERRATVAEQYKITTGVWLAKRSYERRKRRKLPVGAAKL